MNFLRHFSPSRISSQVADRGILAVQRETFLQYLLNLLLVISAVAIPFIFPILLNARFAEMVISYVVLFGVVALLAYFRNIPYYIRAAVVFILFFALGLLALIDKGLSGSGVLLLFFTAILSSLLFSSWVGGVLSILCVTPLGVVGYLMTTQPDFLPTQKEMLSSSDPASWIMAGAVFVLARVFIGIAGNATTSGLLRALHAQQRLSEELTNSQSELEQRVEERSKDIRKKLSEFEVASQIARDISMETKLESLMQNAVNMIRDRFGFYHAGIFLNDERGEYAVLRAATGEAGRQMLERNHRLKIGEVGIVGYVTQKGEARVAADVRGDSVHYKNPLLPETRSEMALPLRIGPKTIGALDVQSIAENAFAREDVYILQTVADQLAIAFDKAWIMQELQKNLEEMDISQRRSTRQVWQSHLRNARRKYSYRYHASRLDAEAPETLHAREAVEKGQSVVKLIQVTEDNQEKSASVLAVPIKIRNQVLGVVDIQFESTSVSPDLISLIESTVNRLAVSLENARLLEEIQYRAQRERLVSEITTKVRASSEIDNILRVAAQELGRSLGVSEVSVQLRETQRSNTPTDV